MSEQPRDWDREMAEIDRAIAKQGSTPPAGPAPAPAVGRTTPPSAAVVGATPVRRRSVALTWFWVVLGVALSVALGIWPYGRACGLQLFFYLGAAGLTVIVGVLAALASWSHRRGVAHVVALLTLVWAGAVAAHEVLPRIGYAKVARTWTCVAPPAAGVTSGQGTTAPAGPTAGQGSARPAPSIAPGDAVPNGSAPAAGAPSGSVPSGSAPTAGTDLQSTTTPTEAPAPGTSGSPAPRP
jgi:hypothetical protein